MSETSTYTILSNIQDALEAVSGVTTCCIGIPTDISPDLFPIIAIVPISSQHGEAMHRRKLDVYVYAGVAQTESDAGLEDLYSVLDALEEAIREKMESSASFSAVWASTEYSDETIEGGYRLLAAKYQVVA